MRNLSTLVLACGLVACGGARTVSPSEPPPSERTEKLATGWTAPDFSAQDRSGERFQLHRALEDGPVVLVFYRGFW